MEASIKNKLNIPFLKLVLAIGTFLFLLLVLQVYRSAANGLPDADRDGVPDEDESGLYFTDPNNPDTDGDGYSDWLELNKGYSPWEKTDKKMEETDFDKDGLSDRQEISWRTNPTKADTDGDGASDKKEIDSASNPKSSSTEKLVKNIKINLKDQVLSYYLGDYKIGSFIVSSGVHGTTPKGTFEIANKNVKAWSSYGLWMPYWLGLKGQRFGLHELPYWPSGRREGETSLGHPASHGCVRMGRHGEAETLYKWAEIGTKVVIY